MTSEQSGDGVRKPSGGWNRFWFSPADPTTLGAVRMATGLLLLYVHGSSMLALPDFVGPRGVLDVAAMDRVRELTSQVVEAPGGAARDYWLGTVSFWFYVHQPVWMWVAQALFICAIAALVVGFWSRTASVLVWLGNMSFLHRAYMTSFGLDAIT